MTAAPILTANAVSQVMIACLCDEGIPGQMVEGVESEFCLNPEALQLATSRIQRLLSELPDEFRDTNEKAGAWSGLNVVQDRHGNRWAPDHLHAEALMVLGLAVDLAEWTFPRERWEGLPGGWPYFTVLASKFQGLSDD